MRFLTEILAKAGITSNYVQLDTLAATPGGAPGRIVWNDVDGTLEFQMKGGNVTQQIGQELPVLVKHADNTGLTNGKVVYQFSSDGSNVTVKYASASSEATASKTFGVMTEDATGGAKGFCTTFGYVRNINTSALTEGAMIWLSETPGEMTTTRPTQPAHGVVVGRCIRQHATEGVIFVSIQNGFELDELHDVLITSKTNNDFIVYESATNLWKNKTISAVLGYTPANGANYLALTGGTLTGDLTLSGANPRLYFTDTDNNPDYFISNTDGTFTVYDVTNSVGRFKIYSTGNAEFTGALSGTSATFNGIIAANSQTTATNGSINVESADPAIRFRVTGGTANSRIYEWRAVAAGGVNDIMQLRLWNDAQNSASTLFTVSPIGAATFSSSVSATNIILGTGTIGSIPSWMKVITTDTTQSGLGAVYNNKAIYVYNNGSALKIDAYDYGVGAGLDIQVGGNGGKIILSNGQVRFSAYTSSTSYSGTAAGYLAFDSSGNVITVAGVAATDNTKLPLTGGALTGPLTITGNGSYLGDWGYKTLELNDTSGYPGIFFRNGNNIWIIRRNGADNAMDWAYSTDASAQGTGTFTHKMRLASDQWWVSTYPNYKMRIIGGDILEALNGTSATTLYLQYHSNTGGSVNISASKFIFASTGLATFNGSGIANAPNLRINTSSSASFVHTQENFAANLTAGQRAMIFFGKVGSTKNAGGVGYYWAGDASNSNFITLGHWGNDDLFRIYGDGLVMATTNFVVGTQQGFDNPGGWNKNVLIDGTNHGRFRIKASNYTYGNIDVSFWADSSVSPSHGISGSNAVFSFGGSITSLTVGGQTVIHAGNIGSQSVSNAATLGGYSPNQTGGAYTIVQRDSNGYIQNSYFYTSGGGSERGTGISYVAGFNSSDYYIRSYTLQGLASAMSGVSMNINGNASTASGANGNFYIDDNYGNTIVGVYTSTRYQGVFAMGDSYKLPADGSSTGSLYGLAWSHPNAGGVASNLNTHGLLVMENGTFLAAISGSIRARDDMRAPIFYDSNDTGYYLDPNTTGTSGRFRGEIFLGPNTSGRYTRLGGNGGGTDEATVSASNGNLHIDCKGGYGLYLNYYSTNTIYLGNNGYTIAGNGSYYNGRAAVADNANSISSATGSSYNWTGIQYFVSNRNTSSDSPPLQAYSNNGSGAIMSFHRGGYYAVNFGLDSDNVMRIGGWSAGANRWQLDMSGNQTVAGNVTASLDVYSNNGWFYSNNNAGWYNNTYGQGLRQSKANVSYGNVITVGENYNGWSGYNTTNTYVTCFMQNSAGDHGFYQEGGGAGWTFFFNKGNHCAGIGTDNTWSGDGLRVVKQISAEYGFTTWSDRRAKENISPIVSALDKVLSMRGVYFNYIKDQAKTKRVGFIAQELQAVLPEVVNYAEEIDEYNVNYGQVVSLLTEGIKEQQAIIVSQNSKIERLEALVEQLINK